MYEGEFYKDRKERCFTTEFLNELQTKVRVKVVKWIEKLEKEGPNLPRPYADIIRGKIRQNNNFTQKELAKRLNTTQQTISRLENIRNRSYSLQTLIKLARIFNKRVNVEFRDVVKK
jgi:DNA-binding XRE family transcriptional regulator